MELYHTFGDYGPSEDTEYQIDIGNLKYEIEEAIEKAAKEIRIMVDPIKSRITQLQAELDKLKERGSKIISLSSVAEVETAFHELRTSLDSTYDWVRDVPDSLHNAMHDCSLSYLLDKSAELHFEVEEY